MHFSRRQKLNASTKYIIRDSTTTDGRAHRGTVKTEARQRCTPGERGCGCPPQGGVQYRGGLAIFIGQFWVFVYLSLIIWFLFPHLTYPSTLSNMCMQLFPKGDSRPETYVGALASHIMGWYPLLFDPQGAFLHLWNVSLAPRMGNIWLPDSLLKQGLALLCCYHDRCLKVSTGHKAWLLTLYLLLLPFWEGTQEDGCK